MMVSRPHSLGITLWDFNQFKSLFQWQKSVEKKTVKNLRLIFEIILTWQNKLTTRKNALTSRRRGMIVSHLSATHLLESATLHQA